MIDSSKPALVGQHDGLGLVERLRAPSMTDTTATHIDRMRMAADEIERAWAARDAALADLEAHAAAEVQRAVAAERERCAVAAWNHFMDICIKTRRAPAMWEEWCAAGAIRKQASSLDNVRGKPPTSGWNSLARLVDEAKDRR